MVFMIVFGTILAISLVWFLNACRKDRIRRKLTESRQCCGVAQAATNGTTNSAAPKPSPIPKPNDNSSRECNSVASATVNMEPGPSEPTRGGKPPPSYIDVMNAFWESQGYCPIEVSPRYIGKMSSRPSV